VNKFLLIFAAALIFISCQEDEKPQDILPEERYEKVFIELTIADQMNEELLKEKTRRDYREEIFNEYDITEEKFNRSHRYYEQRVDEQIARMEQINLKLREVRDTLATLERSFEQARADGTLDSLIQSMSESP
jgi:response regulator RpfG family c-di-GMP phosphodiesterase